MKNEKLRLQKYLADCGVCSRRKAEELIAAGKVRVNGRTARIGDSVLSGKDDVQIGSEKIRRQSKKVYIILNKPRGYITTLDDEQGRKCVADLVSGINERIFPVGRLDRESEGLLLMTSDGNFANILTHPSKHVPKTYRVTVKGNVTDVQLAAFSVGMLLEGRKTAPAHVKVLTQQEGRTVLEVILTEGRNRQIRKMCEQQQLEVLRLKRTAIGQLKLGMLPPGKFRELETAEVKALIKSSTMTAKP